MQIDGDPREAALVFTAAMPAPPPPPPPPPAEALSAAIAEYRALLAEPASVVAADMTAQERADCAFNCARVRARRAREGGGRAARRDGGAGLLLSRAEVADDADLAPLLQAEWMQALLGRLPA